MANVALENLSKDDIRILVRHPDAERRAHAVQRICRTIRAAKLTEEEREFARRLVAHIAEDAVAMVRRALAVTLQNSPELPRDVAKKLAADIDNIAIPVIKHSPVLTDQDLIEVLRSKASAKVLAVAKRPIVSGNLVKAVIRYGDSSAVAELAANDGAMIDIKTAENILELYRDNDLIKEAFISRQDLPSRVVEKLITMVSEEAALILNQQHKLPANLAIALASRAHERATLDVLDLDDTERETQLMVRRLYQEGRLTNSLIIRAAGSGKMCLLKYALALRSDISPEKSALMVHDGGPIGMQALCQRSGLNIHETRFVRAACSIYRDLEISGLDYDDSYFKMLMTERILTLPYELPQNDKEWFLERLDSLG